MTDKKENCREHWEKQQKHNNILDLKMKVDRIVESVKGEVGTNLDEAIKEIEKMLKRDYEEVCPLEKIGIHRKLFIKDSSCVKFHFPKKEDFNFWVKERYMKNADGVSILPNILNNDTTINYEVVYSIDRLEDIYCMNWLQREYINSLYIKNVSLRQILRSALKINFNKNIFVHEDYIDETQKQAEIFDEIVRQLKKEDKNCIKYLYDKYLMEIETYKCISDLISWQYGHYLCDIKKQNYYINTAYEKYNNTIKEILEIDLKNFNNTSELTLYKLVKDIFPDAIYQYKSDWLNTLSLDIFIPSIRVGIEYQGEQHYRPINYFGGDESYSKQKERDFKKKILCVENDVNLIEYEYTLPISSDSLKIKLIDNNVKLKKERYLINKIK